MIPVAVVALELLSCLGLGAAMLRAFGVAPVLQPPERLVWSFTLGFGALGWLLFFLGSAGLLRDGPLLLLLVAAACYVVLLRPLELDFRPPAGFIAWTLVVLLALVLGGDLLEGLSPPADADTLAYHFSQIKDYLAAGRLVAVERAADGTQPMLAQLTYLPALALGGERALTLWTMVSGWGAAAMLYVTLHRFVSARWALAAVLVLLTTPTVVFGAGTGQIEIRSAMMVLALAMAIHLAHSSNHLAPMALAGLLSGFVAATKYHGLILLAAAGLAMLYRGRRIPNAVVFAACALVGGFQWYVWNWIQFGDPVYPMLSALGLGTNVDWTADFNAWFKVGIIDANLPAPINVGWWLFYPISATFAGLPLFESGRTGLGLFVALLTPFALLGAWGARDRLRTHPLVPTILIAFFFYTLWFFSGAGQRVRFLLPVYPLVLAGVVVAAVRYAEASRHVVVLAAAFLIALAIQFAGAALFSVNYVRHVFSGESRDAFLERNIGPYEAVRWINANLTASDRVFTVERQTIYLYEVPVHYGNVYTDPTVDIRPTTPAPRTIHQLRARGITHVLAGPGQTNIVFEEYKNCFESVKTFPIKIIASRTLNDVQPATDITLYRLLPQCPIAPAAELK
jgi:hypothetical protein